MERSFRRPRIASSSTFVSSACIGPIYQSDISRRYSSRRRAASSIRGGMGGPAGEPVRATKGRRRGGRPAPVQVHDPGALPGPPEGEPDGRHREHGRRRGGPPRALRNPHPGRGRVPDAARRAPEGPQGRRGDRGPRPGPHAGLTGSVGVYPNGAGPGLWRIRTEFTFHPPGVSTSPSSTRRTSSRGAGRSSLTIVSLTTPNTVAEDPSIDWTKTLFTRPVLTASFPRMAAILEGLNVASTSVAKLPTAKSLICATSSSIVFALKVVRAARNRRDVSATSTCC